MRKVGKSSKCAGFCFQMLSSVYFVIELRMTWFTSLVSVKVLEACFMNNSNLHLDFQQIRALIFFSHGLK